MISQRLAIPELDRVFQGDSIAGLSEWQLLERYLERRDESAFEALVKRHGPMVLGVCRRALGFSPDADDAFQATFLILIRRAGDLGPRDAIGPWLYGVATRVAERARKRATRRSAVQTVPLEFPVVDTREAGGDPELVVIIDQELNRLPSKYRSPMVLCYLEGRTHEEAARLLSWPVGTVKGRLARARELLRSRLSRRGFAPSTGPILAVASRDLVHVLDPSLIGRTMALSSRLAAGHAISQVVSQSIISLVEGVLSAMLATSFKWAVLAIVATGFALTTAAVLGRQEAEPDPGPPQSQAKSTSGTAGQKSYSKALAPSPSESMPRTFERPAAKVKTQEQPRTADVRADDPRSRIILQKLDATISMSFANETPLDDVLKYIKQATTTPTYSGIPIYVDPVGLQEAERSINSTIQMDLEGVPLRRTLQLVLAQIGLMYFVDDGILVITNEDLEQSSLPPSMNEPPPILRRLKKAERGELSAAEMTELLEVLQLRKHIREVERAEHEGGAVPQKDAEVKELIKELKELIQLLKAEKEARDRPQMKKAAHRS